VNQAIESLRGRRANILGHEKSYIYAVMLPLVQIDGEIQVLFEKRSPQLRLQPGEICFPGGGIEDLDSNYAGASVRETCEELGLKEEDIDLVCALDILINPYNAITYPFVGFIRDCNLIRPNHEEVDEVFYIPLSYLLENRPIFRKMDLRYEPPEDFPFELIPQGKNYPFRPAAHPLLFYVWKNYVIWGMTARILYHFLGLIRPHFSSVSK